MDETIKGIGRREKKLEKRRQNIDTNGGYGYKRSPNAPPIPENVDGGDNKKKIVIF